MFDKYTYRQKNRFLLVVFLLLLLVTYKRSISLSLDVYSNIEKIESQIQNADSAQFEIQNKRQQLTQIDRLVNVQKNTTKEEVERNILALLMRKKEVYSFDIQEISPIHEVNSDNYLITTFIIRIKGSYKGFLNLIYDIEKDYKNSRIASLNIEKIKNTKIKKNELYATIYFQNYIR